MKIQTHKYYTLFSDFGRYPTAGTPHPVSTLWNGAIFPGLTDAEAADSLRRWGNEPAWRHAINLWTGRRAQLMALRDGICIYNNSVICIPLETWQGALNELLVVSQCEFLIAYLIHGRIPWPADVNDEYLSRNVIDGRLQVSISPKDSGSATDLSGIDVRYVWTGSKLRQFTEHHGPYCQLPVRDHVNTFEEMGIWD